MGYKIKLEIFEGPLDLLLFLVKKDHLNIYDIPIAKITDQYLKYLELMKLLDLNIAGEFLVMAATLMQIKSKMLLPPVEEPPGEEEADPRQELVKRLLEYEKFKELAETLRQRESGQQDIFRRPKSADRLEPPAPREVYFEANIFDLISAFSHVLEEVPKEVFYEVLKDEFTIEEKTHQILHLLLEKPVVSLSSLFCQSKNKIEVVVTFLAILELIRLKEIIAWQKGLFEEIEISRNTNNIIPYERSNPAETN